MKIYDHVNKEKNQNWFQAESFRGITLTEEWLKRLGGKKELNASKSKTIFVFEDKISVAIFETYCTVAIQSIVAGAVFLTELKYVHQLQNLFFSLCGTELTTGE